VKGEFLAEYVGKLIDPAIANRVDDQTFIYYFSLSGKQYR